MKMLYENPPFGGEIVKSLSFFKTAAMEFARQLEEDERINLGSTNSEHRKSTNQVPFRGSTENDSSTSSKPGKYQVSTKEAQNSYILRGRNSTVEETAKQLGTSRTRTLSIEDTTSSKPLSPIPVSVSGGMETVKKAEVPSHKENIPHEASHGFKRFSLQIEPQFHEAPKRDSIKSQIEKKEIRDAEKESKNVIIQTDKVIPENHAHLEKTQEINKLPRPTPEPPRPSKVLTTTHPQPILDPLKPKYTETVIKPPPPISQPPTIKPKFEEPPRHPMGASAICNDGTYSFSQNRRGTCSHHGGVRQWLN